MIIKELAIKAINADAAQSKVGDVTFVCLAERSTYHIALAPRRKITGNAPIEDLFAEQVIMK